MKRIIILLGVVISAAAASIVFGQIRTEGIIAYEIKVNMHRNIPEDRQELKERIPEFRVTKHQLAFNNTESLFTPVVDEEEDADFPRGGPGGGPGGGGPGGGPGGPGGGRMRFRGQRADFYVNQANSQLLIRREMMGKYYLIDDTLKIAAWKFGKETKTVVGYECKQAMIYDSAFKQNIVAWYAPKLKPFLGPELFNTLPGAVLEVDVNEGERVITAKKVELRPLKKNELKVPSQGTHITQAEFKKLMDEQAERMRSNGGGMMIRN